MYYVCILLQSYDIPYIYTYYVYIYIYVFFCFLSSIQFARSGVEFSQLSSRSFSEIAMFSNRQVEIGQVTAVLCLEHKEISVPMGFGVTRWQFVSCLGGKNGEKLEFE